MTSSRTAAPPNLHIFVNRRKFGEESGVKARMTGAEIAGLVGVAAENAVVRRDNDMDSREVQPNEEIDVHQAEHFLVTRKVVNGGWTLYVESRRVR
ncbi:MAG: hypothetical protein M3Z54_08325 [Gemmatimonadota bacterium]|nr:hypothetical protein [Gemmatimonadota bacterium]